MLEGMPQLLVRAGWVGRESTNDEGSKLMCCFRLGVLLVGVRDACELDIGACMLQF